MESQTGRAFIGVRELLLRGELARGERISELPLVTRLGISRTPIRLALERLAHIGLLDSVPSGGFTVREFTIADAFDAIESRCQRIAAHRTDLAAAVREEQKHRGDDEHDSAHHGFDDVTAHPSCPSPFADYSGRHGS